MGRLDSNLGSSASNGAHFNVYQSILFPPISPQWDSSEVHVKEHNKAMENWETPWL
jgi:hypothetical protein